MLRLLLLVLGFLTTGVGACLDRRGLGVWTLERRLDLRIAGAVLLAALAGLLALVAARWLPVVGTVVGTLALVAVGMLLAVTIAPVQGLS
ncbi:hypothetical protein [Actinomycetospora sp. NBRC 106378]|uniref:hypothetical protein n=1 Tax=Actinomycetospora sp. NBRC 106378 TaxID=3032208 RepID=UPI0024A573E7|nr:hypothetical protein [Actinomycetospora sp. NBRC 106378]GLZ55510.1 hypothetical protein Acsp07_51270 [Actinomycetospora sp. NBRC 106378]